MKKGLVINVAGEVGHIISHCCACVIPLWAHGSLGLETNVSFGHSMGLIICCCCTLLMDFGGRGLKFD